MKKIFLLTAFFSSVVYCYAELSVTLNVETPGSLSTMIASSRKSQITHLTINGSINGSDIKYIREMAGAGYKRTISDSALEYLDLSNASIVQGGDYYSFEHYYSSSVGYQFTDKQYKTENNIVTPFMFDNCYRLKTLILPKTVTKIEANAFFYTSIQAITLPENLESLECTIPSFNLSEITIPETNRNFRNVDGSLYSYDMKTLYRCPVSYNNPIFTIPEGVENIYSSAFYSCTNIKEFKNSSTLKSFGPGSLSWMSLDKFELNPNIKYISIGSFTAINEVTILDGYSTFDAASVFGRGSGSTSIERNEVKVSNLKIYCTTPPTIPDIWSSFNKATLTGNLYVPKGSYSAYYIAFGWGDFAHIYEMEDNENSKKCAKPTISYLNGKLIFDCETDGVTYKSSITDSDVSSYSSKEIQLGVTYNISVYTIKEGYDNSDLVTATLCWIDADPNTEGINNGIAQVRAHGILIQTENSNVNITGLDDGTKVYVFGINGQLVGSAISHNGNVKMVTNLHPNNIAIVKIGDKSIKVVIK